MTGQGTTRARSARSLAAEAAFRARVDELGGACIYERWTSLDDPHEAICSKGHPCSPLPRGVIRGQGLCRVCVGTDPATSEAGFRARVAELGGQCVYEHWSGNRKPHKVICINGHDCSPRPANVQQGHGICRICAGVDSGTAETSFRARVAELGGRCVYTQWANTHTPHSVICPAGHLCAPRPSDIQRGTGLCRICARQVWDDFYVVTNSVAGRLKFGITSGDPRPRLSEHSRHGYRVAERVLTNLPDTTAPDLERLVKSTLRLAGERPAQGREYFGIHVLTTVLDIVDNYPIPDRGTSVQ